MPTPSSPKIAPKAARAEPAGVVNIERVAELAGVSSSTVSRILNGTATVSDAKKRAVDDAIARLGFVPNPMARGLAGGRSLSIGVVTQSVDSPFYGVAMRGVEEALVAAGYSPLFVSGHWNAALESRCISVLRSRRVDGIIVLTGRLSDQTLRQCAKALPIVVTGRSLKAPGLLSLNFDNFRGGWLATRYLLDQGHRRIAFIAGDPGHPDSRERHRGYIAALEEAGIAHDESLVVQGSFQEESGLHAVEQLLDARRRFTAIFAANDQMAMGAALGLHRRSLRIPDDISLVGFDNLPACAYVLPPLTTVHHPAEELGRVAAMAMLQLLRGEKPSVEVPVPRVIERESVRRLAH